MSRYTKRARDNYIYNRTIEESKKYEGKSLEELEKIYREMLNDMEFANRDFTGYFWATKIMCYVLNYKKIGYNKQELKNMIYAFEDDPLP